MNGGINLLKRAQTPQTANARVKKILNVSTILVLVIFIAVLLSLILANIFLSLNIGRMNSQIKNSEVKLNAFSEIEAAQFAIADKLSGLGKIFNFGTNYDLDIKIFETITPSEAEISQLTLDEKGFSIIVTSAKLATLNEFILNLTANEGVKKTFRKIFLDNLTVDQNNIYRMTIEGERTK